MTFNLRFVAFLFGITVLVSCEPRSASDPADVVLTNGGIYTVDKDRNWAESAAIRDGEIIAVGSNTDISVYIGDATEVIDLAGRMAMPGFHDAHVHPLEGGFLMQICDLSKEHGSAKAVFEIIRGCADKSDDEWIMGFGIDLALFGANGPDKSSLDAIATDRYFFIEAADGHTVLVNDRVLELAGINSGTMDPDRGVIERRKNSTEPNGTLREAAYDLVDELRPKRELKSSTIAMRKAVDALNAVGVTSVIDSWAGELELQAWKTLDESGELKLRVRNSIIDEGVFEKHSGADFERVIATRNNYASALINNDSIKIMVDGVLEGETAALVEPYVGLGHSGVLNHSSDDLKARVARYDAMGIQVSMHAMGDNAARAGLDAIEYAQNKNSGNPASGDLRHHLSHLALIDKQDIPRFGQLNASANFTAAWAYLSDWVVDLNVPVVGEDRVARYYPIGSVHEAGGNVVGGSDWIYGPIDPLVSIEVAITRQDPDDAGSEVGNIGDAVALETAIDAYTINAAWLMHQDDRTGSIDVGKRADIVVLDRNLFEIPSTAISDAKVRMTIFDGDVVYRAQ